MMMRLVISVFALVFVLLSLSTPPNFLPTLDDLDCLLGNTWYTQLLKGIILKVISFSIAPLTVPGITILCFSILQIVLFFFFTSTVHKIQVWIIARFFSGQVRVAPLVTDSPSTISTPFVTLIHFHFQNGLELWLYYWKGILCAHNRHCCIRVTALL